MFLCKNFFMNKLFKTLVASLIIFSCSDLDEIQSTNANETNVKSSNARAGDGKDDVLGQGYDVTQEFANANSAGFPVIDVEKLKKGNSSMYIEEKPFVQEYLEEYGENAETYSNVISRKTNATTNFNLFKHEISASFSSSMNNSYKFDSKFIYASYNIMIKQKRLRLNNNTIELQKYLTTNFINDLKVKSAQQIVEDYGTHILTDIYTGAKLEIKYQSETYNSDRTLASRIGLKAGVKGVFNLNVDNEVSTDINQSNRNYNRKLYYRTRGGNPINSLTPNVIDLEGTSVPKIDITAWRNSVNNTNNVLVDIGKSGLVYIYDLIKDPVKKAEVKAYVDNYIKNSQVSLFYADSFINKGGIIQDIISKDIFVMFEGKLRKISINTLKRLFIVDTNRVRQLYPQQLTKFSKGINFSDDSELVYYFFMVNTKSDSGLFLREGNLNRKIHIQDKFPPYLFNIIKNVRVLNSSRGMLIGNTIY
jgi:hypothetical protein